MIEKIAASLARFICTNRTSKNDDSKYEILEYGFECIINTGIPCIIYIIVSIIRQLQSETIIWFSVFIFYRNLIGGYHASSHFKCILFSTLYGGAAILLIPFSLNISIIKKIYIMAIITILHFFLKPVIHHEEDMNSYYLQKTQIKIHILLLTLSLSILILDNIARSLSGAMFIGVLSSELLYLLHFLTLLTAKKAP